MFFLSQRSSFWIASFSVLAFITGNMVGQHGWYMFWASVLGKEEVVYAGTVPPIAYVPDYQKWYQYGGNQFEHTFRQVPKNILQPLPTYTRTSATVPGSVYSVSYMGTYEGHSEGSGSHPGVDIRVPVGTPVLSIANGIVEEVKYDNGFGKLVVVRHPDVPDPDNPTKTTTLYSSYAHLDAVFVQEGMVVSKGEQIALSGQTGFASGPHLHFQIDREEAPWHPFWPFNTAEQHGLSLVEAVNAGVNKNRGFKYTISPMFYVQGNYDAVPSTLVVQQNPVDLLKTSVAERRQSRLQKQQTITNVAVQTAVSSASSISSLSNEPIVVQTVVSTREDREQERANRQVFVERQIGSPVVSTQEVVSTNLGSGFEKQPVVAVRIRHDGFFTGRGWETLTVQLVDKDENVISNPLLQDDMYMRTAYGEAEFRPSILKPSDFINGEATVNMLPRDRRTIVIQARPFVHTSTPLQYQTTR